MNQSKNIFVYGLTGSGKDTVSNYLVENYGYLKLRIADTIKRIICESKNISLEELEIQKRINPELRMLHHEVSQILDNIARFPQSSINRVKQLINGTAFDYQHLVTNNNQFNIDEVNKVICDCRTFGEAKEFLDAGWTGIFLSRTTNEFKHESHFTEQYMFTNGQLAEFIEKYKNQVKVIFNRTQDHPDDCSVCNKLNTIRLNRFCTDGSCETLYDAISEIIDDLMLEE